MVLAGLCLGPGAAAQDLAQLAGRGTLRVLVAADEAPEMFAFGAGEAPGFERELVEGFARRRELAVEVLKVERFEDTLPWLLAGRGDLATGLVDTPERRRSSAFSREVLPVRYVVVTRRPAPPIADTGELARRPVVVVEGTSWARAARAAGVPEARLRGVPDLAAALAALRDGSAAATVLSVAEYVLQARRDPALEAGAVLGERASAAWAVRPDARALRAALDAYLEEVQASPAWSRLVVRYFGQDALAVLDRAKR